MHLLGGERVRRLMRVLCAPRWPPRLAHHQAVEQRRRRGGPALLLLLLLLLLWHNSRLLTISGHVLMHMPANPDCTLTLEL